MTSDDDRPLDFAGLLAELHSLFGRVVVVESSAAGRPAFQAARGLLVAAIDTQIDVGRSANVKRRCVPRVLWFTPTPH
jgi:hypothetical protein